MYRVSASVSGLKELQHAFAQAPQLVEKELRGMVARGASYALNRIKDNAPVDKGELRGSFHIEGPSGRGLAIEAKVGTNITNPPYPLYQEQGTGIYGPNRTPISPKAKPFLAFKTKDGRWVRAKSVKGVKPKWYVRQAREATQNVFHSDTKRTLARITERLAR